MLIALISGAKNAAQDTDASLNAIEMKKYKEYLKKHPDALELPNIACPNSPVDPLPVVEKHGLDYSIPEKAGCAANEACLLFIINAKGAVEDPVLIQSIHPAVDREVLKKIRKWKFKPYKVDGKPVKQIVLLCLSLHPRQ